MKIFRSEDKEVIQDFEYLDKDSIYLDSACQTLRPQQVIDAITDYYHNYNSCGGRVKYDWGLKVDDLIAETRKNILTLLHKSSSEYAVAFTLNTSYGINLVLSQLPSKYKKIVTSEIEHNSVFLPTIEAAKRLDIPRIVLQRSASGSLIYDLSNLAEAIVVLNSMSNIDGRSLSNLKALSHDVHKEMGIVLIDAAQGIGHDLDLLHSSDYDALFFSGHKFYGPSLGIVVIKRSLLSILDSSLIGGGTVEDVEKDVYKLVSSDENIQDRLEIGLQNFAGIIGLNESIKWQSKYKPEGIDKKFHQTNLSEILYNDLLEIDSLHLLNATPSPIISFYSEKVDSHRLAIFLSSQNIMVRSGYFCCHYYLKNLKGYPPLVRVSLGLHNTEEQVKKFLQVLKAILVNI
jgi:cysteine desulfurase/selenocysteine lyase